MSRNNLSCIDMQQQTNGTAQKTLFWLLGSLFAVVLLLLQLNASARSASLDEVRVTANEAKEISVSNRATIQAIEKSILSIDKKLDTLLSRR